MILTRNQLLRWFVLICLCLGGTVLFAQNAQISGRVQDPSGAVIPDAAVSTTNDQTGARRTASTNHEGIYAIPMLQPGTYTVLVQKDGFRPVKRDNVVLQVEDRVTLHFTLEVGAPTEAVTVTGEMPLLRTEDAQTGEVIESKMIKNLPQLNRNPLELLRLSGNVSGTGLATNGSSPISNNPAVGGANSPGDLAIAGGRTGSLEYAVDGQSIVSGRGHEVLANAIPTMESVAEFKVITGGMSAE